MQLLAGKLSVSGGSVRVGDTVRIGYFDQKGLNITQEQEQMTVLQFIQDAIDKPVVEETKTDAVKINVADSGNNMGRRKRLAGKESSVNIEVVETIKAVTTGVSENEARKWLTSFQFPTNKWQDRVYQLSGGERRRLQLLQVLAAAPNLLLLDEPSNDLDLKTLLALEEYLLETFDGCLVVVSHDQFFVNKVAEHLFVFEGDGVVRNFQGTYLEYLDFRKDMMVAARSEKKSKASVLDELTDPSTTTSAMAEKMSPAKDFADPVLSKHESTAPISSIDTKKTKESTESNAAASTSDPISAAPTATLSFNERKEFNRLEKEIGKLTAQISEKEEQLSQSTGQEGFSVLAEWSKNINKLKEDLSVKESRWLELAERA